MFAFDPRQALAHVTPIAGFAQTLQNLVPARHKGQDRVVTRGTSRSPGRVRNPEIRRDHGNGHGTANHGYSVFPSASIATKLTIRRARVSGFFAVWMRCRIA